MVPSRTSPASVLNMVALLWGFGGDHGHVVRGGHRGWFGGRWTAIAIPAYVDRPPENDKAAVIAGRRLDAGTYARLTQVNIAYGMLAGLDVKWTTLALQPVSSGCWWAVIHAVFVAGVVCRRHRMRRLQRCVRRMPMPDSGVMVWRRGLQENVLIIIAMYYDRISTLFNLMTWRDYRKGCHCLCEPGWVSQGTWVSSVKGVGQTGCFLTAGCADSTRRASIDSKSILLGLIGAQRGLHMKMQGKLNCGGADWRGVSEHGLPRLVAGMFHWHMAMPAVEWAVRYKAARRP